MKVHVLLNAAAGKQALHNQHDRVAFVRHAFAAEGVETVIEAIAAAELTAAAADAALGQCDAVVAGGGDGTVSAVATALVGTSKALGILPLGTLNHFAHDLGIPREMQTAAHVIAQNLVRRVDAAEVNGRIFINNASIGAYPAMVQERERIAPSLFNGKWFSMMIALARVLRRFPMVHVRVEAHGTAFEQTTPIVFVGNNNYHVTQLPLAARQDLAQGELSVYRAKTTTRLGLVRLAFRAALGRLLESRDFDVLFARELTVETPRPRTWVAVDGEVVRLESPLKFKIRPASLSVIAPPILPSGSEN